MAKRTYQIPVQKNKYYESVVLDYTSEGFGLVKIEGYPVFIEGALLDETIEFKIIKEGKKFSYGRLTKVINPSPDRVEIRDKKYSQAGIMNLQHMSYPAQLSFKKAQVENVLAKVAGLDLDQVKVFDTIGMENPLGYRNKAQVPVREQGDGKLQTGFFKKNSHDLIPIEDFVIQDPLIDQVIVQVRTILQDFGLRGYDEENHRGDIRHIMVRRGHFTGEIMVVLVSRTENLRYEEEITQRIVDQIPQVVSVVRNINPAKTNVILGREFKVLYGQDAYQDKIFDFTFKISHQSFFQVNSVQTEHLYQTALDYADLSGDEVVIDAYSGIGTMTLALASQAQKVYGVEIVEPAVENARENAQLNQVDNVEFALAKAEDWMVQQKDKGMQADVVVVDPPRKGLDASFVQGVLEVGPDKIVYVSCNPSTLARDLKLFVQGDYRVNKVQPVDMFPMTSHIECVVLMEKVSFKDIHS